MPTPKPGETEKDFMARCMAYPDLQNREPDQRAAVCHSLYREHTSKAKDNDPGLEEIVTKALLSDVQCETGSRTDVSVVSTSTPDSDGDVVVPKGLDWGLFKSRGSPVYLEHRDIQVGRALWIKEVANGFQAKTQYDARPEDWPVEKAYPSEVVFRQVQAGELAGKSVTLAIKSARKALVDEVSKGIKRVIESAVVLAYSVCKAPVNEDAALLAVSKAKEKEKNWVSVADVEERMRTRVLAKVEGLDPEAVAERVLGRLRGRV